MQCNLNAEFVQVCDIFVLRQPNFLSGDYALVTFCGQEALDLYRTLFPQPPGVGLPRAEPRPVLLKLAVPLWAVTLRQATLSVTFTSLGNSD